MKYKPFRRSAAALFTALLLTGTPSCYTDIVEDGQMEKYAFVDVGDAILPVLITGNVNSEVALIFVHGGPGNSGMLFRPFKGLYDLEQDYKVIYYDQRASGLTQGNSPVDEITIEQFSEDLDVLVDFAREVAGASSVFLVGHSWGGGLTTYYLLDPEHQAKLSGYIAVAPAFNPVEAMANSHAVMQAVANAFVLANVRRDYWQGAVEFYDNNPVITQDLFIDHLRYVEEADGVNFSTPQEVDVGLPDYQIQAFAQNLFYTQRHMTIGGEPIFDAMELDSQMGSITLPTLLLWGEKDALIPVVQALDFIEAIGSPQDELYYHGFPVSAHEPMGEEPGVFTNKVSEFVEMFH